VIASIPAGSEADVEDVLSSARRAQAEWARTPAATRGGYLREMADLIDANSERLAELVCEEVGKPLEQARGEVRFAAGFLRYNAEWDRRLEGEVLPGDSPGEVIHLLRVPVGVVVAICPWNFPLAVLCRKLGPALVTGNTVVIKPSEISRWPRSSSCGWSTSTLDCRPGSSTSYAELARRARRSSAHR
jgi:lactaldehyde dehydrogenase / glycolaldehyde dehydrogenase